METVKKQIETKLNTNTPNVNWMKYLKFRKKVKAFEQNNNIK